MAHCSFSNGFKRKECGAAFIEFAISFPLYMMVVLSIIELLYYNFQYVTAQYLVSSAAEEISKGELRDLNGSLTDASNNRYTLNDDQLKTAQRLKLVKTHIMRRVMESKSDFGTWAKQDINLTKRTSADGTDPTRKSGANKFSGDVDKIIDGGINPSASLYGNISVCTIGDYSTVLGNPVTINGKPRVHCGWVSGTGDRHSRPEIGTTALTNQSIPPRDGLPLVISLRYPHKPIAMSFLSNIVGALPIQAEAIIRIEPER